MMFQPSPAFSRGEIHDDDATCSGVCDERHAFFTTLQIETDVIKVGVGQRYICRKNYFLDDLVGRQVDGNQLRTAVGLWSELNAPGVKHPEAFAGGVDNDALN